MGSFNLELKSSLEHDLKKIDKKYLIKIITAIESLSNDPYPLQSKKMRGSESTFRLRVGNYRIIYQIDTHNKVVTVIYVRHRKDSYKR